jgi:hypothetical protein
VWPDVHRTDYALTRNDTQGSGGGRLVIANEAVRGDGDVTTLQPGDVKVKQNANRGSERVQRGFRE